ncbi:hypothetical protein AB0D14_33535 [Streptomyces sp. NPDC048484]|uniref:hypothetical protein n=1 Tax=Streptomyces sp. NPDC048484 TaxID=3155146 RepID=UPI003415ACC1
MVEERFQLGPGERPPFRLALGLVRMRGRVPLVDHLHRMRTEVPQAFVGPAVGRIGQEVAELAYRTLVVAQSGADAPVHSPQVGRPLVDVLRRPLPGHRIGVASEGPDRTLLNAGVSRREIPGELLIAPPLHHRLEDLLVRPQQGQTIDQVQPSGSRHEAVSTHPSSLSVHRI